LAQRLFLQHQLARAWLTGNLHKFTSFHTDFAWDRDTRQVSKKNGSSWIAHRSAFTGCASSGIADATYGVAAASKVSAVVVASAAALKWKVTTGAVPPVQRNVICGQPSSDHLKER
jgi:hypothetical protein